MSTITVSERAAALTRDALVWDNLFPTGPQCGSHEAHVRTLRRMVDAGYDFVSLTHSVDPETMPETITRVAHDRNYFQQHPDLYVLVDTADDVLRARRERKLAVSFNFQGTTAFERDVNLVEVFYRLGVRQALMAYVGSSVIWGLQFGTLDKRPVFEAYAQRLTTRPAYARSVQVNEARQKASPTLG